VKTEEIVFSLIKTENDKNGGMVYEPRVLKMATLLNISPDVFSRIKERLIETGKIGQKGLKLFLV
jgi:hypothetical protein